MLKSHSSRLWRAARQASAAVAALSATLVAAPAQAADYLAAESMEDRKIRIDGLLREWPGGFEKLGQTMRGSVGRTEALVGYDSNYLYLALKTKDSNIARTGAAGKNEDHLTLYLRFPGPPGGHAKLRRVDVYPGDPGKLAAVVKVDGKTVSRAQAVEMAHDSGYHLEARIPWSSLPEASTMRVGLRGVLEYTDASAPGRVKGVVATSKARGKTMPPLTFATETGLMQALIEPKGLGTNPARETFGNVAGGKEYERVAVFGHFLTITGPGYKGGKQFYYNELDVDSAAAIRQLELRDFSGDGKDEIIVRKRIGGGERYREVLQVLQIGPDGAPLQVFAHEVKIQTDDGYVENDVTIRGEGKSAKIVIAQGKHQGIDPGTYKEPTIGGGIEDALLPWQSVASRTYSWKGQGLAKVEEESREPKMSAGTSGPAPSQVKAPPPPRPPTADELLDRVYALYKKDRNVGRSKPSFDFVTDVVEDGAMERVLVHGPDLVVFGKGFKKGLSYTFITVGVKAPKDILDVTARDLTGDGKAEIILRAVLHAKASKELGGDVVTREAVFVYKVIGEHLERIFAAETGRSLGGDRILGGIAFLPRGSGLMIKLVPGRAIGWTEKTYPFPEDKHPAGGLEPLLLPWGSEKSRTYSFEGNAYQLR